MKKIVLVSLVVLVLILALVVGLLAPNEKGNTESSSSMTPEQVLTSEWDKIVSDFSSNINGTEQSDTQSTTGNSSGVSSENASSSENVSNNSSSQTGSETVSSENVSSDSTSYDNRTESGWGEWVE